MGCGVLRHLGSGSSCTVLGRSISLLCFGVLGEVVLWGQAGSCWAGREGRLGSPLPAIH